MTSPTLKALSRKSLTPVEIADLLQKHIGDGSSDFVCQQALDALRRLKDPSVLVVPNVTMLILFAGTELPQCEQVGLIIDLLQIMTDSP